MDIVLWILVGGILGGAGYAYFGCNEGRGIVVSVGGALGGLLGAQMLAPLFRHSLFWETWSTGAGACKNSGAWPPPKPAC